MDDKKEEIKKETEEVKKKEEVKQAEVKQAEGKIKLGTVGNLAFAIFILLIVITGAITYYLVHREKESFSELVSNLPENITELNTIISDDSTDTNEIESIANIIDSAIGTSNTNTVTTDGSSNRKILNDDLYVLYNGLILDVSKMQEVTLQYIDTTKEESDKYIITYYNYENYSFKDSSLGQFSTQVGEGLVKINNVGKIAISEDYEAIPRQIKVINTLPTIVSDNNASLSSNYTNVKTLIVDLDGNGTDEYITILSNKNTGYSVISLFNSTGAKQGDLESIDKTKWKKDSTTEFYLSLSNVDVIDVDNDGIMEILLEVPQPSGDSHVSLLKYNASAVNVLDGTKDIKCSLINE